MTPKTIADYIDNHDNKDSNNDDNNDKDSSNSSKTSSININNNSNNSSNNDNDSSNDNDSNNDKDINNKNDISINSKPLPPLAAVGYVLIEQKCSLFRLEYKKDPTVILLYKIAKEALDHQIQDHNLTVERLIDVATETKKQFKRILEMSDEGNIGIKKMKRLASAGVLYAETCLHKYQWPVLDDSDMMPLPLDLSPNVQPLERSTHIDILPQCRLNHNSMT